MYYLEKSGVYLHGVYWIGDSETEGIKQANKHAKGDKDSYHDWHLMEYIYEKDHPLIYYTNKDEQDKNGARS